MEKNYYIVPINENQELNYIENFSGNLNQAINRANSMCEQLKEVLVHGMITVNVVSADEDKKILYSAF